MTALDLSVISHQVRNGRQEAIMALILTTFLPSSWLKNPNLQNTLVTASTDHRKIVLGGDSFSYILIGLIRNKAKTKSLSHSAAFPKRLAFPYLKSCVTSSET